MAKKRSKPVFTQAFANTKPPRNSIIEESANDERKIAADGFLFLGNVKSGIPIGFAKKTTSKKITRIEVAYPGIGSVTQKTAAKMKIQIITATLKGSSKRT
ncbi:hypothetical protein LEP1GSC161_2900 [Leptospira santarosai str. CBC1416]|uniref:Uncharacterized protein n=1 Tax=Leptospira santarosai str. CBC1416 TaxID=1193059 RepID=M6VII3_9LEPT|nr:hypothetical protein LEP1GSC168_3436 [Leptospira santarosai str. HAI134]EMO57317.1 hypothetical protein LEP1GSC161_2900 [Leptospira santarosai str. CBC1416]EMO84907.1 hypothetical protein LEP1GSC070_2075 [Leptospira santarosai str. AIM]